jgi:hypothetical protein
MALPGVAQLSAFLLSIRTTNASVERPYSALKVTHADSGETSLSLTITEEKILQDYKPV